MGVRESVAKKIRENWAMKSKKKDRTEVSEGGRRERLFFTRIDRYYFVPRELLDHIAFISRFLNTLLSSSSILPQSRLLTAATMFLKGTV